MVEWKKLGEVCKTISPPKKLGKEHYSDVGVYPIIDQGQKEIVGFTDDLTALLPYGEYVLFGDHTRFVKYHDGRFAQGADGLKILKANEPIMPRYFFYAFDNVEVPNRGYSRHWSIAKDLLIPIPSLSEQQRIVSILDTFTSSISNLKQQIEERKKQYEYERDRLLDLEGKEGVEMEKLGEVASPNCSLSYGIVQPGDDVTEGIPVIRPVDLTGTFVNKKGLKKTTKEISDSYKRTILQGNEVLFCVRGTTGVMSLATKELKGCNVTRGIVPISFDNDITKMFVYYQLKSHKLQRTIADKTNGAALKQINIKDLRLLTIPVPSLSTQSHIVSILDTFEASIRNLEGQLALREKQYEYYRNQLLTFD